MRCAVVKDLCCALHPGRTNFMRFSGSCLVIGSPLEQRQLVGRVERSETRRYPLLIADMLFKYNLSVRTPILMINPLFHKAMKGRMRP